MLHRFHGNPVLVISFLEDEIANNLAVGYWKVYITGINSNTGAMRMGFEEGNEPYLEITAAP